MDMLETDYDSDWYLNEWLKSSWESLAAECYERFLAEGRGAMFLDFANSEPWSGLANGLKVPITYRTESDLIEEELEAKHPQLMIDVRRYDPEMQAVFFVRRRTVGFVSMFVSAGTPTPKDAYEKRQIKRSLTTDLGGHRMATG